MRMTLEWCYSSLCIECAGCWSPGDMHDALGRSSTRTLPRIVPGSNTSNQFLKTPCEYESLLGVGSCFGESVTYDLARLCTAHSRIGHRVLAIGMLVPGRLVNRTPQLPVLMLQDWYVHCLKVSWAWRGATKPRPFGTKTGRTCCVAQMYARNNEFATYTTQLRSYFCERPKTSLLYLQTSTRELTT